MKQKSRNVDFGPLPVTVLIPALNEEDNLPAALESVPWARQTIVVDSGSTDATREIAERFGATVVNFEYTPEAGEKKKAWALRSAGIEQPWVFLLDADERVPPALRAEIRQVVTDPDSADGYYVDRELIFMGRSMRSFRPNWYMRLFRTGLGQIENLGLHGLAGTGDNEIHEHVEVSGRRGFLRSALLHDDYRGIGPWIDRHNRYATWESHLYRRLANEPIGVGPVGYWRLDAVQRKRVLRRVWVRLPGRPIIRFALWYIARRGFRDGKEGLTFCFLMAWYEILIGVKLRELAAHEIAGTACESG